MLRASRQLHEAGYLSLGQGRVGMRGAAQRLFQRWLAFLPAFLAPEAEAILQAPLFIERAVLEKSHYLQHFPHQVFASRNERFETYVTPAACLHLYPTLQGRRLSPGECRATVIVARCARFEGGQWRFPFRLADFHMLELVVIGEEGPIHTTRGRLERSIRALFRRFRIPGAWLRATDSFFLGDDDGAKRMQQLKGLKQEYTVKLDNGTVAVASLNNHEAYFSRCFDVKCADGAPATSCCLALGLERLTAVGLLLWGREETQWPPELTQ